MSRIEYKNDVSRAIEEAEGSDGRLNVSARSDGRAYYNARDREDCYTLVWNFEGAATGEYAAYLRNISTDKTLVISSIGLNSEALTRFQLHKVTGTATAGTVLTPSNTVFASSKKASVIAMEGATASTGILSLSEISKHDYAWSGAGGHEEMRLSDRMRLGQDEACALNVFETVGGDVGGVIFFYFE